MSHPHGLRTTPVFPAQLLSTPCSVATMLMSASTCASRAVYGHTRAGWTHLPRKIEPISRRGNHDSVSLLTRAAILVNSVHGSKMCVFSGAVHGGFVWNSARLLRRFRLCQRILG